MGRLWGSMFAGSAVSMSHNGKHPYSGINLIDRTTRSDWYAFSSHRKPRAKPSFEHLASTSL
jgi:hypothetical protein